MIRVKRFFWLPCLILCACLLTACDGSGKLDSVRVENPLDGGELILPVENGRGQLAGTSASFQTRQTPQELYQAYKALEAEKDWQVTPYPSGLLIDQGTGSGARYYWLTVSPEHAKDGRNYRLSNMEATWLIGIDGMRMSGRLRGSRAVMHRRRSQAGQFCCPIICSHGRGWILRNRLGSNPFPWACCIRSPGRRRIFINFMSR